MPEVEAIVFGGVDEGVIMLNNRTDDTVDDNIDVEGNEYAGRYHFNRPILLLAIRLQNKIQRVSIGTTIVTIIE